MRLFDSTLAFPNDFKPRHHAADLQTRYGELPKEELEKKFLAEAAPLQLRELKGHRSVGGMRASIYNAMPLAGVQTLRDFMRDFVASNGG